MNKYFFITNPGDIFHNHANSFSNNIIKKFDFILGGSKYKLFHNKRDVYFIVRKDQFTTYQNNKIIWNRASFKSLYAYLKKCIDKLEEKETNAIISIHWGGFSDIEAEAQVKQCIASDPPPYRLEKGQNCFLSFYSVEHDEITSLDQLPDVINNILKKLEGQDTLNARKSRMKSELAEVWLPLALDFHILSEISKVEENSLSEKIKWDISYKN